MDIGMNRYVALLRAVNVGGTGKLPMVELRSMCESLGWQQVRTYIASGNVIFASAESAEHCKQQLENALEDYAGKPVGVMLRNAAEMAQVLADNPFKDAPGNRVVAIFLDDPPPADLLDGVSGQRNERIGAGKREVYVHYEDGMGDSKLRVAAARTGTARNINTVGKLVRMVGVEFLSVA